MRGHQIGRSLGYTLLQFFVQSREVLVERGNFFIHGSNFFVLCNQFFIYGCQFDCSHRHGLLQSSIVDAQCRYQVGERNVKRHRLLDSLLAPARYPVQCREILGFIKPVTPRGMTKNVVVRHLVFKQKL